MVSVDNLLQQKIDTWLNGPYDEESKATIRQLVAENREAELTDAFYRDLEFGTGGLRGVMGVGSNRMNKYTVGAATQGLCNYLKKSFPGAELKVAIAHDSRNRSPEFARITADVFSANGVRVFFFRELRPTPALSFAIRHLDCHSGVVITASHNPKEYNGYKAYWNDGAQMIAPHDKNTIREVEAIRSADEVNFNRREDLISYLGEEIDRAYLEKVLSLSLSREVIARQQDLKIVYTSLHGTGITLVPQALAQLGFRNVHVVAEQAVPDGNFPTVVYPNPEEKDALRMAVEQARQLDADLVLATDPDADRVGIAVKNARGEFQLLNGNQTASILVYYLLSAWQKAGKLDGNQYIVKTIVTTDLIDKIALKNQVDCFNVLTGFKYIGAMMRELEGRRTFICGGEESYGFLIGDFARDKDAVASCAFIAEVAAVAKDQGISFFDMLTQMYLDFNFYYEKLTTLTKKGKSGAEEIQQMMAELRRNPPQSLHGSPVLLVKDFSTLVETNPQTNLHQPMAHQTGIEQSNVLQFCTADGTKVSARPSGTEPKIKFYFSVNEPLERKEDFDAVLQKLDRKVDAVIAELGLS
ncbi:MAG: phospho-sugar mutase [Ferruginibacter sp.]|nr:phospho-sugar mutase [Cytophagales bacterium]